MATKIKPPQQPQKKKNPYQSYYIAIAVLAVLIAGVLIIFLWPSDKDNKLPDNTVAEQTQDTPPSAPDQAPETVEFEAGKDVDTSDAVKVKMIMENGGEVTMELYPKVAPITVQNFLSLVDEGFYDGLTFHRIIDGFMAQGGAFDPIDQSNDPASSIKGEFAINGVKNNLSHQRGVMSMARQEHDYDSASSQFFICYNGDNTPSLDGQYAAFGCVTDGMEVVDAFLDVGTDANDMPLEEIKIKTIERV